MNPELLFRTSLFDSGMLRELDVVDLEDLKRSSDEELFVRESFELLKEASILTVAATGIRTGDQSVGLPRDHAIIIGHYARTAKLMTTLIRLLPTGTAATSRLP